MRMALTLSPQIQAMKRGAFSGVEEAVEYTMITQEEPESPSGLDPADHSGPKASSTLRRKTPTFDVDASIAQQRGPPAKSLLA